MRDDIDQARRAGYSDDQIASILGQHDPEIKAALDAGYKPAQVLSVAQDTTGQQSRDAMKAQSWGDYVGDLTKGVVYGAGSEAKAVGTALAGPSNIPVDSRGIVGQGVSAAGSVVRDAGSATTQGLGDYKPAAFDALHPVDTAGQLPKAAAEAAPGIGAAMLAGAGAGALGGAIAGPPGAMVGSVGGAALYGFLRYWGGNAQAQAQKEGRSQPTQADLDSTMAVSAAQAGVDAATLKAAGVLGRVGAGGKGIERAIVGPTTVQGAGARGVSNALMRAGESSGIMGAGAGANSIIGQAGMDGLSNVDLHEATNAAATGAGVGGMIAGSRLPASIAGSIKYRTPNEATSAAVGRLVDHMRSDAFPGDPSKPGDTAVNVKMLKGFTDDRLGEMTRDLETRAKADPTGPGAPDAMSPAAREDAIQASSIAKEYHRYLRNGAVLDEKGVGILQDRLSNQPQLLDALLDRSAANWIGDKAGSTETGGLIGKTVGAAFRHPGKAGGALGILSEAIPFLGHGLHALDLASTGGSVLGAALAAKALSKATGLSAVQERPLQTIAERYGSQPGDPISPAMLNGADAVRQAGALRDHPIITPETTPQSPTGAPQAPAQARPQPIPAQPAPAAPEAPQAPQMPRRATGGMSPDHPALSDLIGPSDIQRFAPRSSSPDEMPPASSASAPSPAPEAQASGPRAPQPPASDHILEQMRLQAADENQPLLDVAHLHHRSARAIASDLRQSPEQREFSKSQASQIWHDIISPLEATSTAEQIKRARSAKTVNEGPSPEVAGPQELSPTARETMAAYAPAFLKAVEGAKTPGEASKLTESFLGRFHGRDRAAVSKEIGKTVAAINAAHIHASAKIKLKTSRSGHVKTGHLKANHAKSPRPRVH